MKSVSPALNAFVNAIRSQPDATPAIVECFVITLSTRTQLAWTNADYPVDYNGYSFSCTGPLISGLKYKTSAGLEVDKQQIMLSARQTDRISGVQALQAIADGALDGATIERHRVFLQAPNSAIVGGVMLFHGRVATVDSVGRTRAQVTVASDLIVLDYDMPRNLYQSTCLHTLYDAGCGVVRGAYSASGTVGAGSTASLINWTGAVAGLAQGSIIFTSGVNANLRASIRSVVSGVNLSLIYPAPAAPAIGDAFTVAYGCDRTPNTCSGTFGNLASYRGFPWVPPPQIAF